MPCLAGEFTRHASRWVASGRPILFLPDRSAHPEMPRGWTDISVEGEPYQANFAKVAINVLRKPDSPGNELPELMRRWFEPDAGLPGTNSYVVLEKGAGGWTLRPQRLRDQALQIGESYSRERIPALFGARPSPDWQRSGFVWAGKNMILLVTLEKSGQPKEHQYEDRFLSPNTFQWQSQNRTTQRGKVGQAIRNHVKEVIEVHLFARRSAKSGQQTAPFFYCGPLTFESWEGEKPITVVWSLQQDIPKKTLEHLAGSDLTSG